MGKEKFSVYVHTFPNGKRYVGTTSQNPLRRWNHGKGYAHQTRMRKAIQEFGWENVQSVVIAVNLSAEQAYELEMELISE